VTTSRVNIRPFAPSDAAACTRVFDRAWNAGHPYAPRVIDVAAFAANTRGEEILVAETAEGVVGFASVYRAASFIHNLYVMPAAQGQGIGRALLEQAVALVGGQASLKCQVRNAQSLAFYRHLGWKEGERGTGDAGIWVRLHSPDGSR
jgi:ribosomal protein S18 acetylase RimI-like enzyme